MNTRRNGSSVYRGAGGGSGGILARNDRYFMKSRGAPALTWMTTCASFEGEWFFTTGKLEFFALFPTGHELDTNDNGLSHAIGKKILFCRDGRRKKSQKHVLHTHTHSSSTRRKRRRRRLRKGGHDDDDKTAANRWRLPRGCSRDGGDGCRRRQNYYYYCYYDTRRGEYCNTTHVLPAPATVRKITKIAKPGRVEHDVQIRSTRPKVIFPGAVAGLFRSNPYRFLLEGEAPHRR